MNPIRHHLASERILRKEGSKRRIAKKRRKVKPGVHGRYACSKQQLRELRNLKRKGYIFVNKKPNPIKEG